MRTWRYWVQVRREDNTDSRNRIINFDGNGGDNKIDDFLDLGADDTRNLLDRLEKSYLQRLIANISGRTPRGEASG